MPGLFRTILIDLRRKAEWYYGSGRWPSVLKVLASDGTMAMVLYRLMQWSHRYHLLPLELVFNKLNAVCCNCIIGRGAEFGPGFVLIHSTGVVINRNVRAGSRVYIEHQVTIGAERHQSPRVGSGVFIGAGAKIIGGISIGSGARVGANAVVVKDVPANATVVGIPARVVRVRPAAVPVLEPPSRPKLGSRPHLPVPPAPPRRRARSRLRAWLLLQDAQPEVAT